MRARIRLFGLLAPAALLACGDELGPRIPAAIVVTPEAPRLVTGGTLQLTATVVDASGEGIPGQDVSFRSSEPGLLTVDDAGLLTSAGFAGGALITATSGEISAEVDVTVVLPASSLLGMPESLELNTFEVQLLFLTVTDEDGEPVPDAPIGFQTSDPSVVRAEELENTDGAVQLTGVQAGTATVTVTSGELSAELPITVGRFPSAVIITPSSLVLSPGGSQEMTVALLDRASQEIDGPHTVTWSSDDEALVTVGANGLATATGSEGTARITATIGSLSASIGVFVGTAPAGEVLARVPLAGAHGLAVSPDDRYFVTGSGTFASGALPDFAFPAELPIAGTLVDIALDASGTRAYVVRESGGSTDPGVVVVDLTTNTEVDFIALSFGTPRVAALSADGSVLTVGTSLGLEVVNLAARQSVGIAVGRVRKIARHPSRPLLYATGSSGVLELDDSSGEILRTFDGDSWSFTLTRDGTRLYIVGVDGGTSAWNLETGAQEPGLGAYGEDVAITPDGKFLYVLYPFPDDSRLFIHDAVSGTLLRHIVLGGLAWRIAMSSDGIAVISNEGGAEGWVDFVR